MPPPPGQESACAFLLPTSSVSNYRASPSPGEFEASVLPRGHVPKACVTSINSIKKRHASRLWSPAQPIWLTRRGSRVYTPIREKGSEFGSCSKEVEMKKTVTLALVLALSAAAAHGQAWFPLAWLRRSSRRTPYGGCTIDGRRPPWPRRRLRTSSCSSISSRKAAEGPANCWSSSTIPTPPIRSSSKTTSSSTAPRGARRSAKRSTRSSRSRGRPSSSSSTGTGTRSTGSTPMRLRLRSSTRMC